MDRLVAVDGLQAADVARVVQWRRGYLRFIVDSAADPATAAPKAPRIPTAVIRLDLDKAAKAHEGSTNFNRLLAERSGILLHTIRRIRSGARRWLTSEEAEALLFAAGLDATWRQHVDPLEEQHRQTEAEFEPKRVALDEELRPILRILAASVRGNTSYTAEEQRALDDWRWMHGADWPESVVPLFTLPKDRNQIVLEHFAHEHGRQPEPLPERVRQEALTVLRSRQKRERNDLNDAERAIGRFPIDAARVYELTRGARREGYLADDSKPRGYTTP